MFGACAATWDAEQKARAAEEKEVEGLKQDLEKKIDQVQTDVHRSPFRPMSIKR